jgi:K+-transporting ATPase ATPase C chain
MKQNLKIAILMTVATTVLLGIIYPLLVTGLAQVMFHDKANGQLISQNGTVIGSRIIGQAFSGAGYLHSRPSAAGNGYDAANSNGSQLGPTNQKLIDRVNTDVARLHAENPSQPVPVPVDLVTTSASGLDPDITPAAAEFQVDRIARERGVAPEQVRQVIQQYTSGRQLGFLGEARVNVLEVNLALDEAMGSKKAQLSLATHSERER